MICPFCAETIQEEAILCRFCNARKVHGQWLPPGPTVVQRPVGYYTMRIAGGFFFLSAVLELAGITSAVPLFGDVRTGAIAGVYHLIYTALYLALGYGLWKATVWGPKVIYAGTALYALDRLVYLLDDGARRADLALQTDKLGSMSTLIDFDLINASTVVVVVTSVGCWLGFAAYVYFRRDYFTA